jgi:hypothetical protein
MGHGLDPFQEVGASTGDAQNNRTSAFDPSRVSPLPYGDWNAGLGGFKSSLFVNFYV